MGWFKKLFSGTSSDSDSIHNQEALAKQAALEASRKEKEYKAEPSLPTEKTGVYCDYHSDTFLNEHYEMKWGEGYIINDRVIKPEQYQNFEARFAALGLGQATKAFFAPWTPADGGTLVCERCADKYGLTEKEKMFGHAAAEKWWQERKNRR